jgi:hypothetical protein
MGLVMTVVVMAMVVIVPVVRIRVLIVALMAVENQEIHAERIKGRDEHTRQHREVGKASGGQVAIIDMVEQDVGQLAFVFRLEQGFDRASGQRTYEALRRAAGAFLKREIPLAGIVRRDLKVRDAIRHQVPLLTRHPSAAAALDIEAIAQSLG